MFTASPATRQLADRCPAQELSLRGQYFDINLGDCWPGGRRRTVEATANNQHSLPRVRMRLLQSDFLRTDELECKSVGSQEIPVVTMLMHSLEDQNERDCQELDAKYHYSTEIHPSFSGLLHVSDCRKELRSATSGVSPQVSDRSRMDRHRSLCFLVMLDSNRSNGSGRHIDAHLKPCMPDARTGRWPMDFSLDFGERGPVRRKYLHMHVTRLEEAAHEAGHDDSVVILVDTEISVVPSFGRKVVKCNRA